MNAPPLHCDIAVVGGGPAASVAALRLARTGRHVVQFLGHGDPIGRPPEIVSPSARLLLRRLQLFDAAELGTACVGVLRAWETTEPDFADFALVNAIDGRSVDRSRLHGELSRQARSAGVIQVDARATVHHPAAGASQRLVWGLAAEGAGETFCNWVLQGAGRTAVPHRAVGQGRSRSDNLVALAFAWPRGDHREALVLEAATWGWWYAPPDNGELGHLVFVTDRDLVPREASRRRRWLQDSFAVSSLIAGLGAAPDFSFARGMDAHSGAVDQPILGQTVAIGDAAFSLDPLSGSGIQHALEGACVAADELSETGVIGTAYLAWLDAFRRRQEVVRRSRYTEASRRFPDSDFWRRRVKD